MRARHLLAAALCFAAGCSTPDPPKITPVAVKVTNVSAKGLDLGVTLDAENPNSVDLTARSLTAKVTLESSYDAGTVTVTKRIDLPAGKKTRLDVPVATRWHDVMELGVLASSVKDVGYKVDGTVELGTDSFRVDVPFHLTGIITHQQMVTATLSALPKLPDLLQTP